MATADTSTLTQKEAEQALRDGWMNPDPQPSSIEDVTLESMEGEVEEQTLADIFKNVTVNEDIVLVIDAGAEEFLRRGLAAIKYKANKAAKDAGVEVDNRSLEFRVLPWQPAEKAADPDWEKKSKVQVYLRAKQSIRVHRMFITDKEF